MPMYMSRKTKTRSSKYGVTMKKWHVIYNTYIFNSKKVAVRLLISTNDIFHTLQDYRIIDENDMKLGKY